MAARRPKVALPRHRSQELCDGTGRRRAWAWGAGDLDGDPDLAAVGQAMDAHIGLVAHD